MNPKTPPREMLMLPHLLTTGNLMCGFAALVSAAQGAYGRAAGLILLGILFDSLDGQVARWVGIATDFGVEYDSLADVVTFGIAPAFLWVTFLLPAFGRWGWVSGFLFAVGAALRLARFNVQSGEVNHGHAFRGLPTPGAAGTLAGWTLLVQEVAQPPLWIPWAALALPPLLALLMVSTLPYRHFKRPSLGVYRTSWLIVGFATLLALVVAAPHWALPLMFSGYALSGPLAALWQRRQGPAHPK